MGTTFGEVLKRLREEAGLTQEELAKKCSMQKQSISRYETGAREPNIRTAKIIADALGVKLELLIPNEMDLETPSAETNGNDFPEFISIARAGKKLTPERRAAMLQMLKIAFPEAFTDDE